MDQIKHLTVRNYRSLNEVAVDLPQITVLVGRNGSGKSNFVDVIRFVHDALRLGLDAALSGRGGIGRIRKWSPKGRPYDVTISLKVLLKKQIHEYSFTLGSEKRNDYRVKREFYKVGMINYFEREEDKVRSELPGVDPIPQEKGLILPLLAQLAPIYSYLSNMNFYTIFPNTLRPPQRPSNSYPLDEHGENLASVLRAFLEESKFADELIKSMGHVVPGITDIQVKQVGGFFVTQLKHEDGSSFELSEESDGTLRVLGMLLALFQEPSPTLIALEEPELTIHPGAIGVLSDVIREASLRSQIIVTTHSPDLIARFGVDEIRVVERTNEIGTRVGIVDDVQRQVIEEQLFSSSDLLRIEGLRAQS